MDFLYKKRRLIVVILACTMIGLGVFQMLTGIAIDSNVMKGVEYVVMFGALYLLLVLPKRYDIKKQESASGEENAVGALSDQDNDINETIQIEEKED